MRNPLRAYWFLSVERYKDGNLYSKHHKMFSTGRLTKPTNAMNDAIDRVCDEFSANREEFLVASFNRL